MATSRLCSDLTLLVVTEAVLLVFLLSFYTIHLPSVLFLDLLVYVVEYRS